MNTKYPEKTMKTKLLHMSDTNVFIFQLCSTIKLKHSQQVNRMGKQFRTMSTCICIRSFK